MSSIQLKVKGTGYGGLPSGAHGDTIEAASHGSMEDRVYYRVYSSWGRSFEVRSAYVKAGLREQLKDIVGFQTEDECRSSAYFLRAAN